MIKQQENALNYERLSQASFFCIIQIAMAAMKLVFQRGEGAIRSRINKIYL